MQPLTFSPIFCKTVKDNVFWKPGIGFTLNSLKLSPFNRLWNAYGYRDPNTLWGFFCGSGRRSNKYFCC